MRRGQPVYTNTKAVLSLYVFEQKENTPTIAIISYVWKAMFTTSSTLAKHVILLIFAN